MRSAFEQAVKWELMEKNPCIYSTLPKYTAKKRDIWTAETLFHALEAVSYTHLDVYKRQGIAFFPFADSFITDIDAIVTEKFRESYK